MVGNGPIIIWLDTETFSEVDLKSAGTHRYAEHPSTEITVAQWAVGDGEPQVADCTAHPRSPPPALLALLEDPAAEIWAHNSHFDRTLTRRVWGLDIPVERWRDTMVQAMAHGLPGGLDKIGAALKLPADQAKDARGKALIQLFCKPRPKNSILRRATPATHTAEWLEFLEYSRQDIVAMREIGRRLPRWNYPDNAQELALWHLDQRANDRGFAVDRELAAAALVAVGAEQDRLKVEVSESTDGAVDSAGQRDVLLGYILAEHGVTLPDMRADTLRRRADDPELPEAVRRLLEIRLESTKTSTAKYRTLLAAASGDGRLRNTMQFCGAQRTGRVAHRLFQPGNLPRGTARKQEVAAWISLVKEGAENCLAWKSNTMVLASSALRGSIVAGEGAKLCVSDLRNIEGRVIAWFAGEEWKLEAFRKFDRGEGPDIYVLAYAKSFGTAPDKVGESERQIGKVQELMLAYGGSVGAYLTGAATYGFSVADLVEPVRAAAPRAAWDDAVSAYEWFAKKEMTYGLPIESWVACKMLVNAWRAAHPKTVELWGALQLAFASATVNPGQTFNAGPWLKVRRDGSWLRARLPSGRYLCYLHPQVNNDECSYMGVDQYTRRWSRLRTYGGKLAENVTQALARDVLLYAVPDIEREGYGVVLSIHDELITETPDTPTFSSDRLSELMSAIPPWAPGLPLAAAGFETYRYRKG